jgi:hypothetical protein
MRTIRIGAGAGFADDRVEPAVELADRGDLDYLVFECLAERTIALAQLDRLRDPAAGFTEWLPERMAAVLPACAHRGTKIITNMGAANPLRAAEVVSEVAREAGLKGLRIAAVTGDDVLGLVDADENTVSANAYLGCEPVVQALAQGADVVVTGRIADPSLFLAPLVHEFGWAVDDWPLLGRGLCLGHLLECAGQVTGGYFADPGHKDVPDLAHLGFPLAEAAEDGTFVVTKVAGTGGAVTVPICTEQLLYEVHDPAAYVSADVTADFSAVELTQLGPDRVLVTGATGRPRPDRLKVSVGFLDGFLGEGEISYAGPNAVARGRLALDILRERLHADELRFDLIGIDAVHRGPSTKSAEPPEVRVRVAGRTSTLDAARRIGREVSALWLNGPAGGAGATRRAEQVVAIASTFVDRDDVRPQLSFVEA